VFQKTKTLLSAWLDCAVVKKDSFSMAGICCQNNLIPHVKNLYFSKKDFVKRYFFLNEFFLNVFFVEKNPF
jgi:hypothetical protein